MATISSAPRASKITVDKVLDSRYGPSLMDKEQFYATVGALLGVHHDWTPERQYMRRWGPRTPGNGRYAGHGIVRAYSEDKIHVNLYNPEISGTFKSFEEAISAISKSLTSQPTLLV